MSRTVARAGLDAIGVELAARLPLTDMRTHPMPASYDSGTDDVPARERIAVALARMEERQVAMQDQHRLAQASAAERHQQVLSMFNGFVPRPEIEAKQAATTQRIDDLEGRIELIESRAWKAIAGVLGAVGTSVAALFKIHVQGG